LTSGALAAGDHLGALLDGIGDVRLDLLDRLHVVFGTILTTDPIWAIVWISVASSGLAAASPVGWSARPSSMPGTSTVLRNGVSP
jgi:hypothetical protein